MKQKKMAGIQKHNRYMKNIRNRKEEWNRSSVDIMKSKEQREEDKIWKLVEEYLAMAEDFPEVHSNIIEGAKDMLAQDILTFERQEQYEICSRLKKAFDKLEQLR